MPGTCDQCGKPVGKDPVLRAGKTFCSMDDMKAYGAAHPSKKKNVCEFC